MRPLTPLPTQADIAAAFCCSLEAAARFSVPFPHFYADAVFPICVTDALAALPLAAPPNAAASGRREDIERRIFFNAATMARFPTLEAVAAALQSPTVTGTIARLCAAPLEGCHLRLEYAIDQTGFWLAPHTDIGSKKFTCLISLAGAENQADLGTDIYAAPDRPHSRAPFRRNGALLFVPSQTSWHGFAPRPIAGLRRSIIANYVGSDWQARDQLAFPNAPVAL